MLYLLDYEPHHTFIYSLQASYTYSRTTPGVRMAETPRSPAAYALYRTQPYHTILNALQKTLQIRNIIFTSLSMQTLHIRASLNCLFSSSKVNCLVFDTGLGSRSWLLLALSLVTLSVWLRLEGLFDDVETLLGVGDRAGLSVCDVWLSDLSSSTFDGIILCKIKTFKKLKLNYFF